jgi:hypothetical protein
MFYKLLKCNYGDSQHICENEDHYTKSNATRKQLYRIWKSINDLSLTRLNLRTSTVPLGLDAYYLINSESTYSEMSTQGTGNTCYF